MAFINKIMSNIPEDMKDKIPFLNNLRMFDGNLKKYKQYQHFQSFLDDKRYRFYEEKIKLFHNIHRGDRCFILGTGPSLKEVDLNLLKDEIIFGVNILYKGLSKFDISCKYYAVGDYMVLEQHYKDILNLDTTLFFGGRAGKFYLDHKEEYQKYQKNEPIVIRKIGRTISNGWKIKDLSYGAYASHHVISDLCLQIAYYMGFNEVYLLGCDCDYSGTDHHFNDEKYDFQPAVSLKSTKYWDETFEEYKIAGMEFEKDNRKVYNATKGGKLEVLERVTLEDIIKK